MKSKWESLKLICDFFKYQFLNQNNCFNSNLLLELKRNVTKLEDINHLFTTIDYFVFLLVFLLYVSSFKHLIIISLKNDSIYAKQEKKVWRMKTILEIECIFGLLQQINTCIISELNRHSLCFHFFRSFVHSLDYLMNFELCLKTDTSFQFNGRKIFDL